MLSLTRSFSTLGSYQLAHQITYETRQTSIGQHLSLSKESASGVSAESVLAIISPNEAEDLIRYLYENSIPIENWRDIVEDILPEGCLCS